MRRIRNIGCAAAAAFLLTLIGCGENRKPDYGREQGLYLPGSFRQVWAVAPAVNRSGVRQVDPIIQADLLYQQLQQVAGLTVVPVNQVVAMYAALRIEQVQSEEQAALVCDLLGCDALLVPTITIYDPFEPPKVGAGLSLFRKGGYRRPVDVDPRELVRRATPATMPAAARPAGFVQVVGMFDAANGSVRDRVMRYAAGRNDPEGPYGLRIYLVEADRFCGFVYHEMIEELLAKPALNGVSGKGSN